MLCSFKFQCILNSILPKKVSSNPNVLSKMHLSSNLKPNRNIHIIYLSLWKIVKCFLLPYFDALLRQSADHNKPGDELIK